MQTMEPVITTSKVIILNNKGDATEYTYTLEPIEAIKACVIQEVMKIKNYVGKNIEVNLHETLTAYSYPFGENSVVWVRK